MRLSETAPAKVNLFLAITGRRPDAYHLLDSLVVFADAADQLHAAPADRLSLQITGRFAAGLAPDEDNLVLRAARQPASRRTRTTSCCAPPARWRSTPAYEPARA